VRFKYVDSYEEVPDRVAAGENVVLAIVAEEGRVIGFGIGEQRDGDSEIEIIDVDQSSRRSNGVQRTLTIGDHEFGVGVGHVIVDLLMTALTKPVDVDATGDDSRYIFKSLGFQHREGESNPCLLDLQKDAAR
jgi:hypothetical protein